MGEHTQRRRVLASGLAAVLWLASGLINSAFTWNSVLSGSVGGVMPATVPGVFWGAPSVWSAAVALVGAVSVAIAHYAVTRSVPVQLGRSATVIIAWSAAVGAGAVVGLASDFATIAAALPAARLQWLLDGLGNQAAVGAYWGLVQGWLPALLVASTASLGAGTSRPDGAQARPRAGRAVLSGAVVLVLLGVGSLGFASQRAAHVASIQEDAIANGFDEESGALPDPYAEGTSVPTVKPHAPDRDPALCGDDQAMVLLGDGDAATGHRTQSIELMNFSDTVCSAEGYIDIAFADQNGHALSVKLVRGGSFMTTDAGPERIDIPAGGRAIARLGWNANSTNGELVATTLYAAPFAGDTRGSWPVQTDIIDGSTVNITAWELIAP